MRTGIFYLSHRPSPDASPVVLPSGGTVYIRVEESRKDLFNALDDAQARAGETLMNTHPLPKRRPAARSRKAPR